MSTFRNRAFALGAVLALAGLAIAPAQRGVAPAPAPGSTPPVKLSVPSGVPLSIASVDTSQTEMHPSGGALVIDLRCNLQVRNEGKGIVRSVSFAVLAQQSTIGGKASVAVPSLNIAPGETFPVRMNLRLLRPLPVPQTELVEVVVDGVLFSDLSFFGPDQLDSRRRLMVWEKEAERDRAFLKAALESSGPEGLQQAVLASLARQEQRPRLQARPLGRRGTRLSAAARAAAKRRVTLAFLDVPDSPLEALKGSALVTGRSVESPQVTVKNRSEKQVSYFELGWLVDDARGIRYAAGSLPAPASQIQLSPGESVSTDPQRRFLLRPLRAGENAPDFSVHGMTGYISQVQFKDGSIWIPSRESLRTADLLDVTPVSPEEQRLTDLYRHKGLNALVEELAKF